VKESITFWVAVAGWVVVGFGGVAALLSKGPLMHYEYETNMEIDAAELRKYCPVNAEDLIIKRRTRQLENIRVRL
jgi:hypothetical protein